MLWPSSLSNEVPTIRFVVYLHLILISPITGFNVFTTVLAHESYNHLEDEEIHVFTADVTKDTDITSLRESISSTTDGNLDVLVNCA